MHWQTAETSSYECRNCNGAHWLLQSFKKSKTRHNNRDRKRSRELVACTLIDIVLYCNHCGHCFMGLRRHSPVCRCSMLDRDERGDDTCRLAIMRLRSDDGADQGRDLVDAVWPFRRGGRLVVVFPVCRRRVGAAGAEQLHADVAGA